MESPTYNRPPIILFPGLGSANRHLPRKAPEQTMQTESGDQQGVAVEGGRREPLQSHDEPEAKGHRGPGIEFC